MDIGKTGRLGRLCAILAVLASSYLYLPLHDILCSNYAAACTAGSLAEPTLRSLIFESGNIIHMARLSGKLCHPIRIGATVTVSHLARLTFYLLLRTVLPYCEEEVDSHGL